MKRTTVRDVMTAQAVAVRKDASFTESVLVDSQPFAVTVHDGVVTLTGRPETDQAGHELAERLRHIEGVVAVRDQLRYAGAA
jgi:osmotically-inducible protein OsmY